jgi:RIO kinase 1
LVEQEDPQSAGFASSYKAAYLGHHEQRWITSALGGFYEDWVITDVLRLVKGGKEAAVYCCAAHKSTGLDLIAAKIYFPRMFRSLKNDAPYREGRIALSDEGKVIRDRRSRLAMQKKTWYGLGLHIGSWIEHEYQTLCLLYDMGIDVSEPLGQRGNAILMGYIGDELVPAPILQRVSLRQDEAQVLFERVM